MMPKRFLGKDSCSSCPACDTIVSMNDEPELNHIDEDSDIPATKGDVRAAVNELAQATNNAITTELKPIRSDIAELKAGQGRLERSQQAILDVVQSIDQQLREHKTHPDRIARLERSVFRR